MVSTFTAWRQANSNIFSTVHRRFSDATTDEPARFTVEAYGDAAKLTFNIFDDLVAFVASPQCWRIDTEPLQMAVITLECQGRWSSLWLHPRILPSIKRVPFSKQFPEKLLGLSIRF